MTKTLDTLVADIYEIFNGDTTGITEERAAMFAKSLSDMILTKLTSGPREPQLSMSNLGKPDRQLWYALNKPECAEDISPKTKMNFLLGDIVEEVVLFLAECAGHEVTGRQDTLEINGCLGHRDAVIDGVLVDVKSANGRSYTKFLYNKIEEDDPFGYIDQLNLYRAASDNDPSVTTHDKAAFVAVNKEVGGIHVNWQPAKGNRKEYEDLVQRKRDMINSPVVPERCYPAQPDGKSGNMKLGVNCSYCPFKKECWPGLRTFLYSSGPRHLVKVVKEPDVYEVRDTMSGEKF